MSSNRSISIAASGRAALASLLLISVAACDSIGGPDREAVAVSFSGKASATAAALRANAAAGITVTSGANTLVIDRAQIVLRRIQLKRAAGLSCTGTDSTVVAGSASDSTDDDSSRADSSHHSSDDDCHEINVGPMLVDLPLTDGTLTSVTATVPRDTYREIEFRIHKLGDDTPEERALAAAHPEFDRNSIRVEGTFNGTPFVFLSSLSEERELEFSPPIVVDEGNENVTIQFDVASWFRSGSGIINPATANKDGQNEELVRNNIRASIRAFGDDDRNGR
jgi:hypothetical protein